MYTIFAILIALVCVLLVLIILVQSPKGGGLSSSFGGSQQVMGVQKTTDFLEKATWTLAIALFGLSMLSNFAIDHGDAEQEGARFETDYLPTPATEAVEFEAPPEKSAE